MFSAPCSASKDFNPRSPCGERLVAENVYFGDSKFQSTLPMRGATTRHSSLDNPPYISIHAPHAGSDDGYYGHADGFHGFQSTLPMRGATAKYPCHPRHQNISIHAPHAGSDLAYVDPLRRGESFQSTLPMRGATSLTGQHGGRKNISIHAPHAGSDHRRVEQHTGKDYFNPRSPCGERLVRGAGGDRHILFQSTLPMRGATSPWAPGSVLWSISIHAPHAGSDLGDRPFFEAAYSFQSTLPMRGATAKTHKKQKLS